MAEKRKVEKVWGFTVASFFGLLAIYAGKYVLDFWILPKLLPGLYPSSTGAFIAWLISSLVVVALCMKFITRFGYFYPVAQIVYSLLVLIAPCGLYGMTEWWGGIVGAVVSYIALDLIGRGILWIFILIGFVTM